MKVLGAVLLAAVIIGLSAETAAYFVDNNDLFVRRVVFIVSMILINVVGIIYIFDEAHAAITLYRARRKRFFQGRSR